MTTATPTIKHPSGRKIREILEHVFAREADFHGFCVDTWAKYWITRRPSNVSVQDLITRLFEIIDLSEVWAAMSNDQRINTHPRFLEAHQEFTQSNVEQQNNNRRDKLENELRWLKSSNENSLKDSKRIKEIAIQLESPWLEGYLVKDRYLLIEWLGHGGTAVVWRAVDIRAAASEPAIYDVAIRVLRRSFSDKSEQVNRLRRGTELLRKWWFPGLVRVLAPVQDDQGIYFAVMEYIPGGSLKDLLRRPDRSEVHDRKAMRAVIDIGRALQNIHGHNYVHRDVKPSNILLDAEGKPRLNDLDEATQFDPNQAHSNVGHGTSDTQVSSSRHNSAPYTAPEPSDGKQVHPATDVFSLAMTAVAVLIGKEPDESWNNRQADEIMHHPKIPRQAKYVLAKAVNRTISERYQTAAEFSAALEAALTAEGFFESYEEKLNKVQSETSKTNDALRNSHNAHNMLKAKIEKVRIGFYVLLSIALLYASIIYMWRLYEQPKTAEAKDKSVKDFGTAVPHNQDMAAEMSAHPELPPLLPPKSATQKRLSVPQQTMALIAKGSFTPSWLPAGKQVDVGPYYLDYYEVSIADYKACQDDKICNEPIEVGGLFEGKMLMQADKEFLEKRYCTDLNQSPPDFPLNCISYDGAEQFCKWLDKRLPTEIEWEYAARGREGRQFAWGTGSVTADKTNGCGKDCFKKLEAQSYFKIPFLRPLSSQKGLYAKFPETSSLRLASIRDFEHTDRTAHAIIGMGGNVAEWTSANLCEPTSEATCDKTMVRGGAWDDSFDAAFLSTFRREKPKTWKMVNIGFRCAKSAVDEAAASPAAGAGKDSADRIPKD